MSGGAFVARATTEDTAALAELARACFTHPWTEGQLRAEIAWAGDGALLVLFSGAPGARPRPRAFCAYRVLFDDVEILDVAVDPAWRRRGLARFLIELALRRAARAGARSALLEVRAGNEAARALYRSLGFQATGVRRAYYTAPVEDALLLRREGLRHAR